MIFNSVSWGGEKEVWNSDGGDSNLDDWLLLIVTTEQQTGQK